MFFSNPEDRNKYLKGFIALASSRDKRIWASELQAEPWEPGEMVHLDKESPLTCKADEFLVTFRELSLLGIDAVFLWGLSIGFTGVKCTTTINGWNRP